MRISEMLKAMASWLESPNNEALLLSEYDDDCIKIVAESCLQAAEILKIAAQETDLLEPQEKTNLTPNSLNELAAIASEFDNSEDVNLKKQASVIDELLLTIAESREYVAKKKAEEDDRINKLKKNYDESSKRSSELDKKDKASKNIDKSKYYKDVTLDTEPLQTRYCPDHPGVMARRVTDHKIQCPLDKKNYDYEAGFTLEDGTKVMGKSVDKQTDMDTFQQASIFSTRG